MHSGVDIVTSTGTRGEQDAVSMHHYAASVGRQRWLVIVLLLVSTLATIDRQIISLLVNPIREQLQISDTQISLVIGAAFAVANTVFTLPAGYFADRVSRRGLIMAGALIWSIMTMACGAASSFLQLFLARAGLGFGESVIQPCALSMIRAALPPERRGRGFAVHAMAIMGGSALALMAGGALIGVITASGIDQIPLFGQVSPWQLTLIAIGAVGLPVSALMLTVREPPRQQDEGARTRGGYGDALSLIGRQWRVYVPLFVFQLGQGMLSMAYAAWLAAMLGRVWHLTYAQIGFSLGVMMLILPALGLGVSGHITDSLTKRIGARGPALVGFLSTVLVGVAATAAPLAPSLAAFWVLVGALMLVSGTVFPVTATLTALITPAESMGKVVAVQLFLNGLIAAVMGPTVVAIVSDTFFSGPRALADALSLVCATYSVISLAGIAIVLSTIKRAQVR
jgi:MFS transporter, Spinster family, sphingosine-1-phosphate transporter